MCESDAPSDKEVRNDPNALHMCVPKTRTECQQSANRKLPEALRCMGETSSKHRGFSRVPEVSLEPTHPKRIEARRASEPLSVPATLPFRKERCWNRATFRYACLMSLEVHCINSGRGNRVASRSSGDTFAAVGIDCWVHFLVDPSGQTDWVLFRSLRGSDAAAGLVRAAACRIPTERLPWWDLRVEQRPALSQSLAADGSAELDL